MAQQAAFGTQFQIDNGGTYTTVAYVRDISGPSFSMDTVETSNHGSTSGWRTFVPGLIDGGEVSLDLLFDPSTATQMNSTGLLSELIGRTVEGFKIIWPDAATFTFDGLVTAFEPGAPFEDALTGSVTVKVTGAITIA